MGAARKLNDGVVSFAPDNGVTTSGQETADRAAATSQKVSEQALFYVGSMFFTWVFPSSARFSQMINGSSPFALLALTTISAPLQGALNSLVYFKPRYERYRQNNPNLTIGEFLSRHLGSIFVSKT